MSRVKEFYQLTKPGIIYGNSIHGLAGALFAMAMHQGSWTALLGVLVGTGVVIASACVVNNIIDQDIDAKMMRTKKRALPLGKISRRTAAFYALALAVGGFSTLIFATNWLVVLLGLVAYVFYTIFYTYSKRTTIHSTIIGSVPGALPIMAGYVALSGQIDLMAWLLLLLVAFWQLPHFYAISLFRKNEYAAAGLPVLAVVKPERTVIWAICFFAVMYSTAAVAIGWSGSIAPLPAGLLIAGALAWVWQCSAGFTTSVPEKWAKKVFGASLLLSLALPLVAGLNLVLN